MPYPIYLNDDCIDFDNDASATSFGWSFQVHAGIFLVLCYFKEFQSLKIESKLQDIEIILNDGTMVLAQAKSSKDPSSVHDEKGRLKDALISLAKSAPEGARLIYITNMIHTFKNYNGECDDVISDYNLCNNKTKEELKDVLNATKTGIKNKINKFKHDTKRMNKMLAILGKVEKLDITKLNISFITSYSTNLATRFRAIKDKIIYCLSEIIKINRDKSVAIHSKLFDNWRLSFCDNSTLSDDESVSKELSRNDILWPIIIYLIDSDNYDVSDIMSSSVDSSLVNECQDILNSGNAVYHERFDFSNKVMHAYSEYKRTHKNSKNVEKEFIAEKWDNFSTEFEPNDRIKVEYLTKMFMLKIIYNNRDVERVNNFAGGTSNEN